MNHQKALEQLAPIADEMLSGLHADSAMKRRIRDAAAQGRPVRRRVRLVPALCCAALALVCAGAGAARLGGSGSGAQIMKIETIAAGNPTALPAVTVADLSSGAQVRADAPEAKQLFARASGDIPMVSVDGAVYRLLTSPKDMGASLLGEAIGTVSIATQEPSLSSQDELRAGVSNVAAEGTTVYAVRGLSTSTAVAAEVDGRLRLFQRVSYAGRGPGSQSLEDTFSVRGRVKSLALSGVGELEGEAANAAIAVLLDHATLTSADQTASRQTLTVTLDSGLRLQLGVSGDTLCGCGGWSCPEFFEAFEAAL